MRTTGIRNPFHEGERAAQERAGAGDVAARVGSFIRDFLPEQHRDFHTNLPFLVVSAADARGRTWVTLLEGPEGFVTSPDPRHLGITTTLQADDPLVAAFNEGSDIGVVGIELATRRRNRFSGHVRPSGDGYVIDIRQTFGNCPQHIRERAVAQVETTPGVALRSNALNEHQIARIIAADTLFIGSGHPKADGAARGYDASHRGGVPGFVHAPSPKRLLIPDYAGNNFFNTIGNILSDPRVGLLFIDFETGGLLHVTGRATIDWSPKGAHDPDAWRMIAVDIEAVIDRPGAVSLRWTKMDHVSRRLRIAKKIRESDAITSFYLTPADGRPLDPFEAGQHLPIEVQIPGHRGISRRSYSLSGPPQERRFYRISVKRENKGLVSRFLHDDLQEGSLIEAKKPSGEFVVPCSDCPLVLVSAGVGLTPMLSAIWANVDQQERDVWYVHGARNGAADAMRKEVAGLIEASPRLREKLFYSQPGADERLGEDYDAKGRITAESLLALGAGPDARYMLCGPAAFLSGLQRDLEAAGIPPTSILYETFGPEGQSST
ncbi:pyridoxamine 5'-phosphate oxidase family protein [Shinella sp. 838]|uniref:FAD-binding oxidoreductase n=1 Tax=Shinella sp. 838 TaxID=3038164 RepID=UPI0024152B0A|nr:pyridoxamine 5'-phosphate oxidase family protein [Shinella sp. 838]MDG4674872.1 pyridoxamine 5'-phosphate oxidase family protein [Shinella sp. 838]